MVSKLSGVSRVAKNKGKNELEEKVEIPIEKSRKKGGGRKKTAENHPE